MKKHQIFVLLKELLLRMTKRILLSINYFPYHIMEGNGVGNHRLQHLIGLTDPREPKGGAPGKGAGKRSREKKKGGNRTQCHRALSAFVLHGGLHYTFRKRRNNVSQSVLM